jgi:hypothetical protein
MTIEQQAVKFCKQLDAIKPLFDSQPPAHDLNMCDEWLRDMHGRYLQVVGIDARAKGLFAQAMAAVIRTTTDEEFKRFKNSSSLVEYVAQCDYPNTGMLVASCKELLRLMQMASDNYRTLISAVKQEKGMAPRNAV